MIRLKAFLQSGVAVGGKIMLKRKKGMSFQTVLMVIAVIGLTISLIVFFPNIANVKDSFFNLLGLGSTCRETGESYQKHLHDLQQAILKEDYEKTAELYEIMKRCFSRRENDIKKEAMDSFNAYVEKAERVIDGDGFLALFRLMKNTIGTGLKETDKLKRLVRDAYLDSIQKRYDKVKEKIDIALNPQNRGLEPFQIIANYERDARGEFKNLNNTCHRQIEYEEFRARIRAECEQKIREINSSFIRIDCLYWENLGEFELEVNAYFCSSDEISRGGRPIVDACVSRRAQAYILFTFLREKYKPYERECRDIMENAMGKQQEIESLIAEINRKYPHRDPQTGDLLPNGEYNLLALICDSFRGVPSRGSMGKSAVETKPEISRYTCNYLQREGGECVACNPILNPQPATSAS